jgi:hypothetical protein
VATPQQPADPGRPSAVPTARRARLVLAVAAGVVALLCLGGAGIFLVLYDDATEIDRQNPDQVVSSYLRASLIQRDDAQAKLYVCADGGGLEPVEALRSEMQRREAEFNVQVSVSWGPLTKVPVGGDVLVQTQLTIAGSSRGQSRSQRHEQWEFRTADQDGWRVCSARKVS